MTAERKLKISDMEFTNKLRIWRAINLAARVPCYCRSPIVGAVRVIDHVRFVAARNNWISRST